MARQFKDKVLATVQQIPRGSVMTYREVAKKAGNEKAARAVGSILSRNFTSDVPCHRVIRSDGRAGGYNRGTRAKVRLLRKEGVEVKT